MTEREEYIAIIKHAKEEMKNGNRPVEPYSGSGEFYEFHHVLMVSTHPLWKNRKSNIVCLTLEEHFRALFNLENIS